MSKNLNKFIEKAKNKFSRIGLCFKGNEATHCQDSYQSITIVELPETPGKLKTLKKQSAKVNLNDQKESNEESIFDISKMPFLLTTPEKQKCNLTINILDISIPNYSDFNQGIIKKHRKIRSKPKRNSINKEIFI